MIAEQEAPVEGQDFRRVEHEIVLSQRQLDAFRALGNDAIDELLYGGAKGGGKSVFGCNWVYIRCKQLIKDFGLVPPANAKLIPVVGFMGRKQSVDFTSTTLNTWKRVIPADAYRLATIENSVKIVVIEETVAVQYGGLDDSDTIKKFNSAEYCFFFLDQAEECSEQDVAMLRGTLRLKIKDSRTQDYRSPAYKALLTANPAICWLKPAFIITPQPRTRFIQALPTDNPFLDPGYVERLKKAFAFKPELLKAYLEGSWDDLDQAFVCIPHRHIMKNVDNEQHDKRIVKRVTVCDVSGEGDDETVIYDLVNTKIVKEEIYSHRSLMDTTGRIQAHARENQSNLISVDKVGEGAGVYSRLCEIFQNDNRMSVYGFDGRVSAPAGIDKETYRNYKTFAWFKAARKFAESQCDIPNDPTLIAQLGSVTWHYDSSEVIQLDKKEDLKAKLKHSPDRADAYVMGLDALDYAEPVKKVDAYVNENFTRPSRIHRLNPDAL
jgi:phage terminase large subunit